MTSIHYAYTGLSAVVNADILGRVLEAGDDALAWATKNGPTSVVFGNATPPAGYDEDTPTPLYEANAFATCGFAFSAVSLVSATRTATR